jgi:uncharacterized membrane protein
MSFAAGRTRWCRSASGSAVLLMLRWRLQKGMFMVRKLFRTEEAETSRVEAFSDGVLAIVITLLVLDIKVPQTADSDAALWQAILQRLPMIGAWMVSFFFVLVFWVAHHTLFYQIEKTDRGLLWLNGLFLLAISFSPFPTALAGEHPGATPAVFLLSLVMFLAAAFFAAYSDPRGRRGVATAIVRLLALSQESASTPMGREDLGAAARRGLREAWQS